MSKSKNLQAFTLIVIIYSLALRSELPSMLKIKSDGKLGYISDSLGNVIPDYSHVGYKNSESAIPSVNIVETLSPASDDNLAAIQAAINRISEKDADSNGIRGCLLLKKGKYKINGTIEVKKSGIVIRGEGTDKKNGTQLIATLRNQHTLVKFRGSSGFEKKASTEKPIKNSYVPVGAKDVVIESGHTFTIGDNVILEHIPRYEWIVMLGMHNFAGSNSDCVNWTFDEYRMKYYRVVQKVEGDTIILDAPVVDPIDIEYSDACIYKVNYGGIEQTGIENLCLISEYENYEDERHGWVAVEFVNCKNSWARNVDTWHFGYGAVRVSNANSFFITIDSCKCYDPISKTTGGRKYSFECNGQRCLLMNCYTRSGRHDFVNGARAPGPNVFLQSKAERQKSDIGPHHRWTTGCLYDNITGNGAINVQNRLCSGTGHGWSGAQTMFWNCTAKSIIVQSPPQHFNWAIGCKSKVTSTGSYSETADFPGKIELTRKTVEPSSLFIKQLSDRLDVTGFGNSKPDQSF